VHVRIDDAGQDVVPGGIEVRRPVERGARRLNRIPEDVMSVPPLTTRS
jgi:hypothetical protein